MRTPRSWPKRKRCPDPILRFSDSPPQHICKPHGSPSSRNPRQADKRKQRQSKPIRRSRPRITEYTTWQQPDSNVSEFQETSCCCHGRGAARRGVGWERSGVVLSLLSSASFLLSWSTVVLSSSCTKNEKQKPKKTKTKQKPLH